jgi:hypothetical protein
MTNAKNAKTPGQVIDAATVRTNGHKIDSREAIELAPNGATARQLVLAQGQALSQILSNATGLVASFLESRGYITDEQLKEWKLFVTGMTFDETAQSLRITGLELRYKAGGWQ